MNINKGSWRHNTIFVAQSKTWLEKTTFNVAIFFTHCLEKQVVLFVHFIKLN